MEIWEVVMVGVKGMHRSSTVWFAFYNCHLVVTGLPLICERLMSA